MSKPSKSEGYITFRKDTELTGYMKLRMWVEAKDHDEMDLFVTVKKLSTTGEELLPHLENWEQKMKEMEKGNATMFITLCLEFLIAVAFITMISCLFMIRHKISNDIEEQMQSIGVLEALGYKSKEISLAYLYEYLNIHNKDEIPDALIRAAYASTADVAMIQMQDILKLGNDARMNQPSTVGGNWRWRMDSELLDESRRAWIRNLAAVYRR